MAERAHPDDPGFRWRTKVKLKWGFVPVIVRNAYRREFERRYAWVNRNCGGADVLDVPCGMGWGTARLDRARTRTGVDISAEAVAEGRRRYPHVEFYEGSMADLPFDVDHFDVVSCLEGIEHVPREVGGAFIDEAARVVKSDGLLLLSSPYCRNGRHSGNPHHVYEYPPDEITELVERRFHIRRWFEGEAGPLTIRYIEATPRPSC